MRLTLLRGTANPSVPSSSGTQEGSSQCGASRARLDLADCDDDKHDLEAGGPRADRPKRWHFTAEYKLRAVEEYDAATLYRSRAPKIQKAGSDDWNRPLTWWSYGDLNPSPLRCEANST
jgi:hypothetical protein